MLRSTKELRGYMIRATDDDIGKVYEFYFDDEAWTVRYLVGDIGSWLSSRLVFISRSDLGQPDYTAHILPVKLTKEQVENSPNTNTAKPFYRQRKRGLDSDWPLYWGGGRLLVAGTVAAYPHKETKRKEVSIQEQESDPHLRSTREVIGYRIQASDGEIGHVESFVVDDETWSIRRVIIDTRNWLPGKKVLMPTQWIEEVCWHNYRVCVNLPRETVRNFPTHLLRTGREDMKL